jgi:hypothetical protein
MLELVLLFVFMDLQAEEGERAVIRPCSSPANDPQRLLFGLVRFLRRLLSQITTNSNPSHRPACFLLQACKQAV